VSRIDLSIIIPSYMEAARIGDTLERLAAFLATREYGEVEVLVVVADSPDGTSRLAAEKAGLFKQLRVIDAGPKVGKGRDVRLGIFESRGTCRVFMDADLATPLIHLDDVVTLTAQGAKVGIAVRNLSSIHKELVRIFVSMVGNVLAQVILLPGLKDTQCGFKFFEAKAAEEIFGRMTIMGWGFDLEVLALSRKLGYDIAIIKAPDWTDPKSSDEGFVGDSAMGAALQVFRDLFTVRWNLIRGRYNSKTYLHHSIY
jgi:dolichyl-phosphate beta-glucosyltransferase